MKNFEDYSKVLSLSIMVKNEAANIEATLKPFIEARIPIIVYDTGSTDGTPDVVINMTQNETSYIKLVSGQFVDFSTSRNHLLELSKTLIPTKYTLMLDAEWYAENVESLIRFCDANESLDQVYLIKIYTATIEYYRAYLFRNDSDVKFVGAVHEVPDYNAVVKVPDFKIFWNPHPCSQEKSALRWYRDLQLLREEFKKDPSPRTTFYLGQTLHCMGEKEAALKYYLMREEMNGWVEENFYTFYRIGLLCHELKDFSRAHFYYLKAYGYRPSRIEPLLRLSDMYWHDLKESAVSFVYAHMALLIDQPDDVLFLSKPDYDYNRYDHVSRSAWYCGKFEIGKMATLKALEINPNAEHLASNLELYTDKLK